jgi:DNA-binding HxlR family transcriptional regulator
MTNTNQHIVSKSSSSLPSAENSDANAAENSAIADARTEPGVLPNSTAPLAPECDLASDLAVDVVGEPLSEHGNDAQADGDSGYCPYFQHVVELLGRRWTSSIVMHLTKGPARFSDIAGAIPKLSDRLLTERLHELEAERLIERTWNDTCTYYQFSELGQELLPSIEALKEFSHKAAPTIVLATSPGRRG